MFANDLTGMCRGSIFGGDISTQIPVALHPWGTIPYGYGLGTAGQVFNPAYNFLFNRIPQTFVHPGFVPQTLGQVNPFAQHQQGFVPQTLGQMNPIAQNPFVAQTLGQVNPIAQNPFVPLSATNVPFGNTILPHTGLTTGQLGYGYGFNPYAFCNWNIPQGFQGAICR